MKQYFLTGDGRYARLLRAIAEMCFTTACIHEIEDDASLRQGNDCVEQLLRPGSIVHSERRRVHKQIGSERGSFFKREYFACREFAALRGEELRLKLFSPFTCAVHNRDM